MKEIEVQQRILNKGVKADDIKHSGRLSADQIRSIPIESVYMWINTGKWKQKDFLKWLSMR